MNYFNYFTEIEERFQQRRGSLLMLSTLDWALIETWREAGVPVECVLRGIDAAFDRHDAKLLRGGARRPRKVNGLAWCAQAVMEAVEQGREAATGTVRDAEREARASGFEAERVARYLMGNAAQLLRAAVSLPEVARGAAVEIADRMRELAAKVDVDGRAEGANCDLEGLDRTLSVLEEKLFAALLTAAHEEQLTALRAQADRELAPYRGRMGAVQIRQVQQQFLQKRLLEARGLPRLSLFYMPHEDADGGE